MFGIDPEFKAFEPMFDFAKGVEAAFADTHTPYAAAYMVYLKAKPFGNAIVHQHKDTSTGTIKTEKVEAFSDNHTLFVCRTIDNETRIFKYSVPSAAGMLLSEAFLIVEDHQRMSTLHLR